MRGQLLERYGKKTWLQLTAEGYAGAIWTAGRARLSARRPVERFVIFAQGRTGSTLLTSSLDSHPAIRCADEILDRPRGDPKAYVENRARICGHSAFGFHVKCYQLSRIHGIDDWRTFLSGLSDDGWKIVYLWRENVVRHVVSGFFAQEGGRYHYRGTERRPKRIRIDPVRFSNWIDQRVELLERERRALQGLSHYELCYERDLAEPTRREQALAELQRYLRIEPAPLSSPLKRSVDRPLPELIENLDELEHHLDGTGRAAELLRT